MKIRQNIPNFLTCCNLLCGCLAIVQAFDGSLVWAAYLVGIAAIFDFFDGFVARLLGVSSPIGKDLDSLADMVTFGVVPGVVMGRLLSLDIPSLDIVVDSGWHTTLRFSNAFSYIALVIPVFSAIRLAKFNNDSRQSESFIGLPTPANAILISSLPLILFIQYPSDTGWTIYPPLSALLNEHQGELNWAWKYLLNPYILITSTFILSFLLVAELPLFALKFKSFGWKGNEIRFIFLGLSLILLITLKFIGIPLIIILYILLSVVNNLIKKKNSPSPEQGSGLS